MTEAEIKAKAEAATKEMMAKFHTPEFQSQLARNMLDHAADENAGVEWEYFVQEVNAKRMGIKLNCNPAKLLRGAAGHIFGVMVITYSVVPFVVIPLWAWHEHKWILLIGVAVSKYASTLEAARSGPPIIISGGTLFGIVAFILWYFRGIESYWTFFTLCGAWGMWWYRRADLFQNQHALRTLVTSKREFESLKSANQFYVVLADGAGNIKRRLTKP